MVAKELYFQQSLSQQMVKGLLRLGPLNDAGDVGTHWPTRMSLPTVYFADKICSDLELELQDLDAQGYPKSNMKGYFSVCKAQGCGSDP